MFVPREGVLCLKMGIENVSECFCMSRGMNWKRRELPRGNFTTSGRRRKLWRRSFCEKLAQTLKPRLFTLAKNGRPLLANSGRSERNEKANWCIVWIPHEHRAHELMRPKVCFWNHSVAILESNYIAFANYNETAKNKIGCRQSRCINCSWKDFLHWN